jgi:chromosome segregation ATPase
MERNDLSEHPLWETLARTEQAMGEAREWLTSPVVPQLRWVLATLRSHDDPRDAAPYAEGLLDGLDQNLTQVYNALSQVKANENGAYLDNAATYVDALTQQIGSLPQVTNRDPARQASRTFADYRQAAEEALESFRARNEELAAQIEERTAAETQRQQAAEQQIEALKAEVVSLEERIEADETRLRTELTNTNEAFNAKQTERQEKFNEWLEEQA